MSRIFLTPTLSVPHPCGPDAGDVYTWNPIADKNAYSGPFDAFVAGPMAALEAKRVGGPTATTEAKRAAGYLQQVADLAATLNAHDIWLSYVRGGSGVHWLASDDAGTVFWHRHSDLVTFIEINDVYIHGQRIGLETWMDLPATRRALLLQQQQQPGQRPNVHNDSDDE